MKRFVFILIILTVVMSFAFISNVCASDIVVKVDEKIVSFPDARPFIDENNRTLVPVRFISESLGAKVEWNGSNKTVTIIKGNDKAVLTIESDVFKWNDLEQKFDTKAIISENRTFVPLRLSANALRASVSWDSSSKTAAISTTSLEAQIAQIPEVSYFTGNKRDSSDCYELQMPDYKMTIVLKDDYLDITSHNQKDVSRKILKVISDFRSIDLVSIFDKAIEANKQIYSENIGNKTMYVFINTRTLGVLVK